LTSTHQNDLKTLKTYYFEVNKKIKKFQILLKVLLKHRNKHVLDEVVEFQQMKWLLKENK